jgi:transcription termination factor Rho
MNTFTFEEFCLQIQRLLPDFRGVLEILPEGFGFLIVSRSDRNPNWISVGPGFIKRYGLRGGDIISGKVRHRGDGELYGALIQISSINGNPRP